MWRVWKGGPCGPTAPRPTSRAGMNRSSGRISRNHPAAFPKPSLSLSPLSQSRSRLASWRSAFLPRELCRAPSAVSRCSVHAATCWMDKMRTLRASSPAHPRVVLKRLHCEHWVRVWASAVLRLEYWMSAVWEKQMYSETELVGLADDCLGLVARRSQVGIFPHTTICSLPNQCPLGTGVFAACRLL